MSQLRLGLDRRVVCFARFPFLLRGLAPVARAFAAWTHTASLETLTDFGPDLILTNDMAMIPRLRQYCDRHNAWLVGYRHGAANKYIGPDPEFRLLDYFCGSEWDHADLSRHDVWPLREFLLTGNPWVDEVFRIPPRAPDQRAPHILVAPTWNPETSAVPFFGDQLVPLIRQVCPASRITIKPHPIVLQPDHPVIVHHGLRAPFAAMVASCQDAAARDPLVTFVTDPAVTVGSLYPEADVLISDGSSLVFEYMALGRPILLYSSGVRPAGIDAVWDDDAPGNAMRDVGAEFSTFDEFTRLLANVFHDHATRHRERQRQHADHLFGQFQDGRSFERVQQALMAVPPDRVTVRVPSRDAWADRFCQEVRAVLRNTQVDREEYSLDREEIAASCTDLVLRPGPDECFTSGRAVTRAIQRRLAAARAPASSCAADSAACGVIGDDDGPLTELDAEHCLAESADGWPMEGTSMRIAVRRHGERRSYQALDFLRMVVRPLHGGSLTLRVSGGVLEPRDHSIPAIHGAPVWALVDLRPGPVRVRLESLDASPFRVTELGLAAPGEIDASGCDEELQRVVQWRETVEAGLLLATLMPEHMAPGATRAEALLQTASYRCFDASDFSALVDPQRDALRWLPFLVAWLVPALEREGVRRIAMFGAGGHTRAMLRLWRRFQGPALGSIVTSGPTGIENIEDVRVVEAQAFDARSVDAIVLSSASHERAMARTCRDRWPWQRVVRVWHDAESHGLRRLFVARRILPWIAVEALRRGEDLSALHSQVAHDAELSAVLAAWTGRGVSAEDSARSRTRTAAPFDIAAAFRV
jgi:CDP-glycerol glycerophosphotransferase (TagB/SpsB family)